MAHSSAPPPPSLREYAPWVDLPDPFTEQILERLPLSDYIRFVAVCPKWRSIQRNHRLRFTRLPPPMLPLPWLIRITRVRLEDPVLCYSPLETPAYRLPVPTFARSKSCFASSHGWLLLFCPTASRCTASRCAFLLNPMSRNWIPFPRVRDASDFILGCISPLPTNPDRIVMLASFYNILVWQASHCDWSEYLLPASLWYEEMIPTIIFCGGRLYVMFRETLAFFVVDLSLISSALCVIPCVILLWYMDWS